MPKATQKATPKPAAQGAKPTIQVQVLSRCAVCCAEIIDGKEEALLCEGKCQKWLHRHCAGLPTSLFSHVSNNSEPFLCLHCSREDQRVTVSKLQQEIAELKAEVSELRSTIEAFRSADKDAIAALTTAIKQLKQDRIPGGTNSSANIMNDKLPQAATSSSAVVSAQPCQSQSISVPQDVRSATKAVVSNESRKFNIVVFGVSETTKGSSRFVRQNNDFLAVSSIITNLEEGTNHTTTIRDCHRLGKYDHSGSRSRPLLVTLNSTADVLRILSKRHLLPSSISIKADLSPTARKVETILLKERWRLIESGANRNSVKIRGTSLYLNGRPYGKVINFEFTLLPNLGDLAPQLSSISASQCQPSTSETSPHDSANTTPACLSTNQPPATTPAVASLSHSPVKQPIVADDTRK